MKNTLKDINFFLLDMDGTFYLSNKIIDGSMEFIKQVTKQNKQYMFLTNNSSHNVPFYINKLHKMGLDITKDEIMTSGLATAIYLNKHFKNKKAYLLGNSFLFSELTSNGIIIDNKNPDYIIVGFDTTLTYQKMCEVCNFAKKGLKIIATHPDINCPVENGFIPDIGAILSFIKTSTNKVPEIIIGKPYKYIFESIFDVKNVNPESTAIVGDRLYTDIKSGIKNNLTTILVLSGETNKKMLKKSDIKPDYVFNNLGEISLKI